VFFAALATAACNTAGLRRAYMALDSQGARQRTSFYTDTTQIFCIGELVSARADVTVEAKIHSLTQVDASGQLVPYDILYTDGEQAPGQTNLFLAAFQMSKEPPAIAAGDTSSQDSLPYPAGDYACDILVDGKLEETLTFSIAFPDCPTVPVANTLGCRGWVKPGSVCPGVVPSQMCTCDAQSGNWKCGP